MLEYECKKDGTHFAISRDDVIRAELENKYLVCPTCGSRKLKKLENIEKIMEERSAVNI